MEHRDKPNKKRYFLKIQGVVQGVGYRPYVYNQAIIFNIKGWVSNQGSALVVDLEGERNNVKEFLKRIIKEPPKLAHIEKIKITPTKLTGYKEFNIVKSSSGENETQFVAGDVSICSECLSDILDPSNPRYQYAFTNCTSCGPRYSIIKRLPYDRINTTMKSFKMCPICEKEYNDPNHRRFHAQPNCCPECGPSLQLLNSKGEDLLSEHQIKDTIHFIKQGKIVAIKGLGGFHLACQAENEEGIEVLRRRKNRPHKPFAIMVKDIETAKELAYISKEEEQVLLSNKSPIVILNKKESSILPDIIAPNTKKIGIMLPYTPLHYLLFKDGISFMVMTSGNVSGGPIQYENDEAVDYLRNIADYFLVHNREIHIPVEDSVAVVIDNKEVVIRRARGYTPYAIDMKVNNEIIAFGAEQKNTFCLSKNGYGYLSQYLGDLKDFDAYSTYKKAIDNLTELLDSTPNMLAFDLQSRYPCLQDPKYQFKRKVIVQHHHAHMVSCMVEYNLFDAVIGVVFDGTGLGTDETIWGGEFLVGTRKSFDRVGHLKYVTIQGGDQAIKEPWRVALSYLHSMNYDANKVLKGINQEEIYMVTQALDKNINCFKTSSMGRFFDCVSSILNLCHRITYDAQGAIELENIVNPSIEEDYEYCIIHKDHVYQIDYDSIILGVLRDLKEEIPTSVISAKFHNTIGNATVDLVCKISKRYDIKQVVLSGGVFQNNYLLLYVSKKLKERDLVVYYNQQIPINDSGISVGQLAIADVIGGKG
ncbi:carbamoyltransferase HypF [Inediibacterium massiliense]|uniref:carbamoyltransferase HypF n=1 Tax=Inediibacterium massiliense TaxID=1658111 RepID=UPI000AB268A2|nr:carbamoyltransferase HypF [Inediibacterium massiliense]